MEKICKNCEYFVRVSMSPGKYTWGDCMKLQRSVFDENSKKTGVFRWADGTCIDFKPKLKPQ